MFHRLPSGNLTLISNNEGLVCKILLFITTVERQSFQTVFTLKRLFNPWTSFCANLLLFSEEIFHKFLMIFHFAEQQSEACGEHVQPRGLHDNNIATTTTTLECHVGLQIPFQKGIHGHAGKSQT